MLASYRERELNMSRLRSPFARPRPMYMTCDTGLEKLVAKELDACGARNIEPGHRGVRFLGIEETMWRANLCSRVGNRVLIPVAEFPAPDKRALYEGAKRVHWSEWFRHDQTGATGEGYGIYRSTETFYAHYGSTMHCMWSMVLCQSRKASTHLASRQTNR